MKAIVAMTITVGFLAAAENAECEGVPPIDAAQPKKFETATFAMG